MDFSRSKIDIVGKSKIWYAISLVFIAIGIIGMVRNTMTTTNHFPLVLGIDFTGGSIIQMEVDNWSGDTAQYAYDVKLLIAKYTEKAPTVQTSIIAASQSDSGNEQLLLQIRTDASLIENPDAQEHLYDDIRALGHDFIILEESEVGAVMGKELTIRAFQGVIVGLILILIYITVRLSFDFAVFAIVALIHDILILLGFYAIFRIEVNSQFVAILLTVVGYSINDTIIIYDRIRENLKVKRHLPFDKLVNTSLLETMARSINTSGTTLIAILALMILGGISLRTFMTGLFVGITTGTYSSIFIGALLLVNWRMRDKEKVIIEDVETPVRPRKPAAMVEEPEYDEEEPEDEQQELITLPDQARDKSKSPGKAKRRRRRH
ncbi:MAG: protein translocase subunit SecF [bacterium]